MSFALSLLADVRWRQQPVVGDRAQALLAALASRGSRPVSADELVELVWGDEPPANAMKSLQVLVSRTRSACGSDAIARDGTGYRLGAAPSEIDSVRLGELVREAAAALDQDAAQAAELAQQALALAAGLPDADHGPGSLAEVRRAAAKDVAAARTIDARAASKMGAHASALAGLEAAWAKQPTDEPLFADLLRSEAAVRGPAAALERYERYRSGLRERLGADPGEPLRRAHSDLLALDRPVRSGLRYEATALIGRDHDLDRLRALTASSRVVSIVGPGGLGKTRLAQAIARQAAVPAVHVVELAGVSAADDVAGEVGSVLGVRDSIQGRRAITTEQRADIRARIAQRLAQSRGLLVLDNCEHLIGTVADLVGFLVAATSDLHVLTTSRAPLGIASEHVYLLGELNTADGTELFGQRAVAARPGVRLDEHIVTSIVERLDGLPLAIELAAVQVRAMSIEEVDQRLEDRFALLRGGDRSAPDRHQTLLAVIDWSWNLLDSGQRRALAQLALFHDGFTLQAAEAVLGADALSAVQGLVAQSLLSVAETTLGVRYRMLETVREFGRMQLAKAGDDQQAGAALRSWAVGYANQHGARLTADMQFAAIDAVACEEVNLADELRAAIADGDLAAVVQLLATLGMLWTLRGEHARLLALADAVADALGDWQPPPQLQEAACAAIAITLANSMIGGSDRSARLLAVLRRMAPAEGSGRRVNGLARVMLAADPADPAGFVTRLELLADDQDRDTGAAASSWLSNMLENAGDLDGAIRAAKCALSLVRDEDGPWLAARTRAELAQLCMHVGDRAAAASYAQAALPVMQRLGAGDDEIQLRSLLACCAIADGRLTDAAAQIHLMQRLSDSHAGFAGRAFEKICQAELVLARGDHADGLALHRSCMVTMRELEFPGVARTGLEPWALFGASIALAAHARYATPADEPHGLEIYHRCRVDALQVLGTAGPDLDYPVVGMLLFGLGAWGLLRCAGPADLAMQLLALADRFAYNRTIPTMMWEQIVPPAEQAEPGRLADLRVRYAARRPADLLAEACRAVGQLAG